MLGSVAVLLGAGVMVGLIALRKPPAGAIAEQTENAVHVEALRMRPVNVPVTILGYGHVKALKTVQIAPEVSGRIVAIHPNSLVGGIIPNGEPLFVIDAEPYRAQVADAEASVTQLEGTVARLREEWKNEQQRMESLTRARDLAKTQFDRLKELFEKEEVGTKTDVDVSEGVYVASQDEVDQLDHALQLYPIRIEEARGALSSAMARLELARINLSKTRVAAPFDARVRQRNVEKDQFVNAGEVVMELADDSVLELAVPLDSRDAQRWLKFDKGDPHREAAWFTELEHVTCSVWWTENEVGEPWKGVLDRVESFDEASRTLTVAVRIQGCDATTDQSTRLPLVDGMFCRVEIPGRVLENVFAIPRSAVTIENTVFAAVENRLTTVPIAIARFDGELAYVSGGLAEGDLVISTRLVNPLDHTLLEVTVLPEVLK